MVEPFVFAFSPAVQLELVAGRLELESRDQDSVHGLVDVVANEAQATSSTVGLAARVGRGEVILLGLAVDQVEEASGRGGLVVVIGIFVSTFDIISTALLVQMMAGMQIVLTAACGGTADGLEAAANLLTHALQVEISIDCRANLGQMIRTLGAYYSILAEIEEVPSGGRVALFGSTANNGPWDAALVVSDLLVSQFRNYGTTQVAHRMVLNSLESRPPSLVGKSTAHFFRMNELFVCQQIDIEMGRL